MFSEEFKELLHNKLLIIKDVKGFECLKKKIPVHPNLSSLSMNAQVDCLVYRALAFVTVKKNNENTCQCHAHSEDKFSPTSSYEMEVTFETYWKQWKLKAAVKSHPKII